MTSLPCLRQSEHMSRMNPSVSLLRAFLARPPGFPLCPDLKRVSLPGWKNRRPFVSSINRAPGKPAKPTHVTPTHVITTRYRAGFRQPEEEQACHSASPREMI